MTGSHYFDKLQRQLTQEAMTKAVIAAAITVNSEIGERIFQKGKAADGSDIGKYDTETPLYVNPKNAPKKFPVKGKNGDKVFADKSPHKTAYFDSYTSYRKKVGRKVGKVILSLFGILESDFVKGPAQINGAAVITLTEENNNKRLGAEEKYDKKIFSLSAQDKELYNELVVGEVKRHMNVK